VGAKKLALWLARYRETGYVTEACRQSGIKRRHLYRLLEQNAEFRRRKEEADHEINSIIEDELLRRGVEGWDEPVYNRKTGERIGKIRR